MKKVSLLILVSLILLLAFASCDKLPPLFGEEPEPEHVHDWMEATCEAPKTCACGATEGEALEHTWLEATCSSPKVCTFCKKTEGSALNHNWVSANCEAPASCTLCGQTSGEALGHVWISASCDSAKHCANCDIVEGEALEHVWEEATCLTPKTCTLCNKTEGEAKGHTEEVVPGFAATCTENGLSDGSVCTVCGVTTLAQKVLPANGHTASDLINDLDPTCTENGKKHTECTVCGEVLNTVVVPALGHDVSEWLEDVAPTCTETGSKHKECLTCGTVLNTQVVPALGHTDGEWVVDVDPTCDTLGHKYMNCAVCNELIKEADVPVLGHTAKDAVQENYVAPTCVLDGSYDEVIYCNDCSAELGRNNVVVPALGHNMADATCLVPSTCTVCGATEGTVLPCKAGEKVVENNVAPTCETAGSYEEVYYCVWCNTELARNLVEVNALGHDMAPATCDAPSTCKNGCGKTEGEPLKNHTVEVSYSDGVLIYTCATCEAIYCADEALAYDGTKLPQLAKNGDPTITVNANGEYEVKAGTQKSQYMLYFPSNSKGHADIFNDFTGARNSVGVLSFKFQAGNVTENIRFIVMTARDNPNWDANGSWNGNSMDLLTVKPNGDGTYTVNGNNITSNTFATVSGDEWVDVKMFMQLTTDGMFNISYYVNGVFCNVYSRDLLNAGSQQTIKDLMIQCVYVCGWTEAGTGWMFDDFYFGYANDCEWVFDDHEHTWAAADCNSPATCTACGLTNGEAVGHDLVAHEGQAPTCTEKGWDAYEACTRCDYSTYSELAATGHNYGSATCDQAATCSVCGYSSGEALGHEFKEDAYVYNNDATCGADGTKTAKCSRCDATDTKTAEGTALEHTFADANCATASSCTKCGATQGEPNKTMHDKLTSTRVNGVTTYSCATCGYSFKVDIGDYMDGSSYDGMTCNASTNNNYYVTNADKANYPALVDGHYEFIRTELEAGTQKQVQIWLPTASGSNKFAGFSSANSATGYLSFKLDVYTDYNFEMKLVDASLPNDYDVNGDGVTEYIRWTEYWGISSPVFSVGVPQGGKAAIVGFGQHITSVDVNENNFTGWLDVAMKITLNPDKDTIDVDYYLNGQYVGSASNALTIASNAITGVYINSNNKAAGTGYKFDDLAFGYTAHKHNFDVKNENGVTTLTCDCGNSFKAETGYYNDGSVRDFYYAANGTMPVVPNNGQFEAIFNPEVATAPEAAGQGWAVNSNNKKLGAQHMWWIPTQTAGQGVQGFSCANNAVGLVSFKIQTNVDDPFAISLCKERGAADWNGWGTSETKLMYIGGYSASGIQIKDAKNAVMTTVPVADGWSEWIDIQVAIELHDNGTYDFYYYVNGALVGSLVGQTMNIDSKDFRALYINGWTYTPGTGVKLDDVVFGYTANGHNTLDGQLHKLTNGANCGEKSTCSCGWTGYTQEHDFAEATCGAPETCKGCGMTRGESLSHNNLTVKVDDEGVKYFCADCNKYYILDGGMHDMGDISDATTAGLYNKTYDGKTLTMLNNGSDTNAQHQFWIPGQTVSPDLAGFTCANNATGFLSFTINSKDDHNTGIEFKVNANRGTGNWGGPTNNGWSESSVGVFKIFPHNANDTTVKIGGYNGATLGNWTMTGTDGWTGEMNVVIKIQLKSDNTVSLDYYINGEFFANVKADMVIWTYDISSLYVNGRTNSEGDGYILSDLYFGYTLNGLNDAPVVEPPIYTEVIDAANVQSESLKTIVASKIKQCDQANPSGNADDLFLEGGTPVYVLAEKDGELVEALYFSRTVAWTGKETKQQFTEFRFDVDGSKKATSISFDYKIKGTVETNDRFTFKDLEGNAFSADAYVQIKTPANHPLAGDNYPELSGTDLVLDGEWHTMTYTFAEPLEIINVLVNLYKFQGELLISNFNVEFEQPVVEEPFYTEEIAKEEVSSSVLQTVVTNKIKQWDQSNAHNDANGTPVFVKADMDGETVTGVYFSKTTPWVGDEGEQFSEFRVDVDGSKKATGFTFIYKVEGTVDENKGSGNGGYTFKDLEGNSFVADAYVQIKTPANHPLAGDNYPELSGTDFILDGQWHTMSYTFAEPLEIINILFNFYHFQGQLIIAELEVTFVEECEHTNTTTTKVDATCTAEGSNKVVCDDCGEVLVDEALPVVAHKLLYKAEGEGVVCYCEYNCGEGYTLAKGYYTDGTNSALIGSLATNNTAGFTTNTNGSPMVSDEGYLFFERQEGYTGLGQVQMHYRTAGWAQADEFFPDFSAAAGANGVLEFDINLNLDTTGNLRFILSDRVESGFGWGTHSITVLTFSPATADGKINVSGWGGNALTTLQKGENGYTGWVKVTITIELSVNDKGQNIGLVKYYFNGEHVGTTHSALNTVVNGRFNNLYITSNHTEVGSGYMFDNLVFGYTPAHTHNFAEEVTAPTCTAAGFTTFTCDCGETYTANEVAALGHNAAPTCGEAATCTACGTTFAATGAHVLSTVANEGKVSVVCAGCERSYLCDTSYVYDGANTTWNWSKNGDPTITVNEEGQYVVKAGEQRSQYMLYIPSSNRNSAMKDFDCESKTLGVVSFDIKTDATETLRVILMEARNSNSGWIDWSNNSVDVFAMNPEADGTYRVTGHSMTSDTLATVNANEWLNVQMIVQLTSDNTMVIKYFLNHEFCGEYVKDFNAEPVTMRLANNLIESLYICGYTGAGTGFTFDNLYIGYTEFGHWTFDGAEHVVTEATSCSAPATCTCGWVGDVLPHNMTEASCSAPATCQTCGFTTGEALHHNYTTLVNNGSVKYLCEDCMLCYSVTTGTLSDGNNPEDNVWKNFVGAGGDKYNGNGAYPALVTGADGNNYFQYLKAETTESANQVQIWLPSSGGKGLQGFTADTNNVGFFSLDFNANMDHNCEWKFVDFSSDAARWSAEWAIDNPFFRMTTPADGKVELRGFNGVAYATVELDENNYTGWMNLAFMITLDAEQDLVIVDYYLNGQYKATMSAALTTKTNGICAVYMNGNAKAAGTGYMVDNIAFGYGSFGTHEHTWTNANCTTAKTCSGCGMTDGEALGHDYDVANCTSPKTCAICDATDGEALGHDMQPATCTSASKCSRCSVTEGEVADHADNNGDFKCDTCSTAMLPADGEALTIAQALAIAKLHSHNTYTTQKYYVTGMITSVANTTYGNLYIEDEDGNKLYIYGLYDATGKTRYDAMNYKPVAGDEVTVYTVLGMYNSTAQGKNAWLDEVIMHEHNYNEQAFAPTCTADGYTLYTCTICTNSYRVDGEEALGHTTENGTCDRCGSQVGGDVANVLPAALVVSSSVANKASADTYITNNHPGWTITGKLGQTYAGMIGFGRSGDTKSSLKSPAISASSSFTVVAVLNGAGASSGVLTSTLTFTLVDESGALVATGYANGKSAVTPAQGKDETFTFTFTFEEGKTWTDVSNLVVSFVKATGNLGLKSITFVEG